MGIAVGVGIGMLTAPRTGKKTREQLLDQFDGESGSGNWKEKANEAIDSVKTQVNQWMSQAEDKTDEMSDKTKSSYDDQRAKNQYNNNVDDMADNAEQGVNKVAASVKTYWWLCAQQHWLSDLLDNMKERPDSPGIGAFAFIRGSTLMRAKPTLNNSPSNILVLQAL